LLIETIVLIVGVGSVVSTETTGKGLADHAISTVAQKDCKISRVVHNEKICRVEPVGTVTVTAPKPRTDTVKQAEDIFALRAGKSR
jgi:hypothetical protein